MTDKTIEQFKNRRLADLEDDELKTYQRELQEKAGLYVRAYRTINTKLRAVGQEIERRKNA